MLLWHKPWSGGELYLQVDKGRLVSQDHSVTSFIAHELILFRSGELARPVSIVGKVLWESRKIIKIAPLPCSFLVLKAICPYHYTMPSAVWHASIGMNVLTWFLLLLRSFALLGANPFSFQFSKIQYFFWQVIWYGGSRVISNGEPSGSSVYEVWMRVGTRWRTLLAVPSLKWPTLWGLVSWPLWPPAAPLKRQRHKLHLVHKNTIHHRMDKISQILFDILMLLTVRNSIWIIFR